MPANANVIIYYGPYEACGIVKHRTTRLQGLQGRQGPVSVFSQFETAKVTRLQKYRTREFCEHRIPKKSKYAQLTSEGHLVKLKEIDEWNRVKLMVNGETVFNCDINELDYGGDGQLDELCSEALKNVQEAY